MKTFSRYFTFVFAIFALFVFTGCEKFVNYKLRKMAELPPRTHKKIVIRKNVMVPMRDGVKLAADIYMPKEGGPWPTVLVRIPYNKKMLVPFFGKAVARRGYACVAQDCRGTFASEGEVFFPILREAEDGKDTVEWIAKQEWFDGNLGAWGGSYFGITQWALAPDNPRLKCFYPIITSANIIDVIYIGGALQYEISSTWTKSVGKQAGNVTEDIKPDLKGGYYNLPLHPSRKIDLRELAYNIEKPEFVGKMFGLKIDLTPKGTIPPEVYNKVTLEIQKFFSYPANTLDQEAFTYGDNYKKVSAPGMFIAGWYDMFSKAQLSDFVRLRNEGKGNARKYSKLIVGPWGHGMPKEMEKHGESAANIKSMVKAATQLPWSERWLKGKRNGIEEGPPVKIYVMGANKWRDENEWPLARMKPVKLYLHSGGKANTLDGDGTLSTAPPTGEESPDHFEFDPSDPIPTVGGSNLVFNVGPKFQNKVEKRKDILVYTFPELKEDVEVTGPIHAVLYASTTAIDTDWTVKLVVVRADGKIINIQDGIIRARYRDGLRNPSLLTPKKIYSYTVDLWSTSYLFRKGRRIRIEVSSSNFPRFERNSGLAGRGGPKAFTVANQRVYHDAEHPSHIVLPVVEGSLAASAND